jgi:prepilin-type N-terminal cleavage/methylation domain-containing protein
MRRAGFTLIEIIITLLIMGVMAAVAAPAFLGEPKPREMEDAQGRLEALFRIARDSAVKIATPVTVVVDSASGLVWFDVRTRMSDELPVDPYATASAASSDGSIRLRTEGAFGGGSTLGLGIRGAIGAARLPGQGESLELPPSIRMELFRARSQFTFEPSGAVMGDSIRRTGTTGETRMISREPWTGRVRAR